MLLPAASIIAKVAHCLVPGSNLGPGRWETCYHALVATATGKMLAGQAPLCPESPNTCPSAHGFHRPRQSSHFTPTPPSRPYTQTYRYDRGQHHRSWSAKVSDTQHCAFSSGVIGGHSHCSHTEVRVPAAPRLVPGSNLGPGRWETCYHALVATATGKMLARQAPLCPESPNTCPSAHGFHRPRHSSLQHFFSSFGILMLSAFSGSPRNWEKITETWNQFFGQTRQSLAYIYVKWR